MVLTHTSPEMEEGFPGNLKLKAIYSLTDSCLLKMENSSTTEKLTLVNLTNNALFNLNGEGSSTILDHSVQINADKFTPIDQSPIPTGKFEDVHGTPFDFTILHQIGERIGVNARQLRNGDGNDYNFVLNKMKVDGEKFAAKIIEDKSGMVMDVYTQSQVYSFIVAILWVVKINSNQEQGMIIGLFLHWRPSIFRIPLINLVLLPSY